LGALKGLLNLLEGGEDHRIEGKIALNLVIGLPWILERLRSSKPYLSEF
jgi:hypothetical protein